MPVRLLDMSEESLKRAVASNIDRGYQRLVARGKLTEDEKDKPLSLARTSNDVRATWRCSAIATSSSRPRPRTSRSEEGDLQGDLVPGAEGRATMRRLEYLVDLDHPAGGVDRPAGKASSACTS